MNLYERYLMAYRRLLPDQSYLQECFVYDPESGSLTWKARPLHHFKNLHGQRIHISRFAGLEAGGVAHRSGGYDLRTVCIGWERYVVARIIFKLVTGEDPIEVDHIDLNPMNMKWDNLRKATGSQNKMNRRVRSNSVTGLKGVKYHPKRVNKHYQARIKINGIETSLGCFNTPEEAHAAYCVASAKLHGEFGRTS